MSRRVRTDLLVASLLAVAVLAGCHHTKGKPLPCGQVTSASCGTACTTDAMCGVGLYCDTTTSMCAAQCVAGGTSCGSGETCDPTDGKCVPTSSSNPDFSTPVVCPAGLSCNVACTTGSTTVSGKVYDPAMKNPLYNVLVYVPATPLTALPKGVPTGAAACSCSALYPSGSLVSTSTAEDGTFTLTNVPVGTAVPLVLQIGKWRRLVTIPVTQCQDNPQADKSLALPGTIAAGDTDDNMPDIAVSTGSSDSLECLMLRMGIPAAEYVAGTATTGHVHVFSGGTNNGGNGVGSPEQTIMPGAPASSTALWSTQAQLMPYDIVLLSCEGGETYNANPPALESYLDAGGRAFASHFHYSWFAGPIDTQQSYTAPTDWGMNLATWVGGSSGGNNAIGGIIDTVLNGSMSPFPKGVSLQKWLTNVDALGKNNVATGELSIYQPRYNATVSSTNTPSQPWITSDNTGMKGATMYLSFDTPVNAPLNDMGAPNYCGRAVFSDLHVAGNPSTSDKGNKPPPASCDNVDLSPQEKALEFMLFDLSSCVIPDTSVPSTGVPIQ